MRLAYYPGCSLHGTAREYDISIRAVCNELGIALEEVPDWNCCGATSAHSLDRELAYLLPARNLRIIENQGLDVIIPCAACFSRTRFCADAIENDKNIRELTEKELGFRFSRRIKIYHLVEFLVKKIGIDKIQTHIKSRLNGLRLVCYYGCLLVRPHQITELDDKENPQLLDELITSLGAATIDWPYKTECCGASLSLTKGDLVNSLVSNMIEWAREAGAQAVVTACPMCQANLEMRQNKDQHFPVFYFTELLGLAFNIKEVRDSLSTHLISTDKLIAEFIPK